MCRHECLHEQTDDDREEGCEQPRLQPVCAGAGEEEIAGEGLIGRQAGELRVDLGQLVSGRALRNGALPRRPLVELDLAAARIERGSGPHRCRPRAPPPPVDQPEHQVDQPRTPVVPVRGIGRALHGLISRIVRHGSLPTHRWPHALLRAGKVARPPSSGRQAGVGDELTLN
jgi:hypothetical protein